MHLPDGDAQKISSPFSKATNLLDTQQPGPFPPIAMESHLPTMTKTDHPKSLSDLRVQIESGSLPTPAAMPVLAFLDLAETAFGEGFHECDMLSSEALFSQHFPSEPTEALSQAFGDATLYRRCRESLHRHARLAGLASGYSKHAVRGRLVAVRALYALTRDKAAFEHEPAKIPWRMLIEEALAGHPQEFSSYRNEWKRLASQYDRRWTSGWRTLQARIVTAGIPRSDNPVEALMEVALETALEPWQLDREWAWGHERSLRPDLRRKWTRMINCFDALHDVPGIKESGRLPAERLGPMPANGARLKNGHFPLPRRFEAMLEGESKQVLEAVHFLYRCLREFGIYSRGDDPAPGALVSEAHLDRVMAEQSFMTPQSARLHIERIRDWRESWPTGPIGALDEGAASSG